MFCYAPAIADCQAKTVKVGGGEKKVSGVNNAKVKSFFPRKLLNLIQARVGKTSLDDYKCCLLPTVLSLDSHHAGSSRFIIIVSDSLLNGRKEERCCTARLTWPCPTCGSTTASPSASSTLWRPALSVDLSSSLDSYSLGCTGNTRPDYKMVKTNQTFASSKLLFLNIYSISCDNNFLSFICFTATLPQNLLFKLQLLSHYALISLAVLNLGIRHAVYKSPVFGYEILDCVSALVAWSLCLAVLLVSPILSNSRGTAPGRVMADLCWFAFKK